MPRRLAEMDYDQVADLAADGLTLSQMASALGIKYGTLYARLNQNEALRTAIRRGCARAGIRCPLKDNTTAQVTGEESRAYLPMTPDDRRVLELITERGQLWRREIRELTGLDYDRINDSLHRLQVEQFAVSAVEDGCRDYYCVRGDEARAREALAAERRPTGDMCAECWRALYPCDIRANERFEYARPFARCESCLDRSVANETALLHLQLA